MHDYSCNSKNSSTTIGVSRPISHRVIGGIITVGNTITMFVLSITLIECFILNSIGSLTMNNLFVYICSVINDLWLLL